MTDFTMEETSMLVEDGYQPGFMLDVREGDLVAIAPGIRSNFDGTTRPIKTLTVQRLLILNNSYYDYESDEMIENVVIKFIGINLDGLPEHCAYSNVYPCFIKKSE